jgi:hypothetical protein
MQKKKNWRDYAYTYIPACLEIGAVVDCPIRIVDIQNVGQFWRLPHQKR